jgi:hypothetical protein
MSLESSQNNHESVPFQPDWGLLDRFISQIEYDEDLTPYYQGKKVSDLMDAAMNSLDPH